MQHSALMLQDTRLRRLLRHIGPEVPRDRSAKRLHAAAAAVAASAAAATAAVAAAAAAVAAPLVLVPGRQLSPADIMLGGGMSSITAAPQPKATAIVHACLRAGIRDFDNAPLYGAGRLTPPSPSLLKHLLKGEGGAAE